MASCFAERLEKHIDLTQRERDALARLEENERAVPRGTLIQRVNEPTTELYVLREGRVMSFIRMPDGNRQILRVFFSGDFIGSASTVYGRAPESLMAMTDVVVCPFDKHALRKLIEDHPRVGALMFVLSQTERVSLTDRLASMGRTSAKARLAAFLMDIFDRLRVMDDAITDRFPLRLTQDEIGDALGLTGMHINRMMRQLADDGLITRSNGDIILLDEDGLKQVGHYINRHESLDLEWLTAA